MIILPSLDILDYLPRFQFGQPGVPWELQKVACTDTCIQMIIHYYKDKLISLNKVRRDAGVVPYGQGLAASQSLRALSLNGVTHYNWTLGYDRAFMLSRLKLGPILVTTNYRYYPTWPGAKCGGNDTQSGGKTDCSFTGAHAVLVIKAIPVYSGTKLIRYDYLVRDPDHDAPARKEKPVFDRMTEAQLKKTMEYITYLPRWGRPVVLYPSKKKVL